MERLFNIIFVSMVQFGILGLCYLLLSIGLWMFGNPAGMMVAVCLGFINIALLCLLGLLFLWKRLNK